MPIPLTVRTEDQEACLQQMFLSSQLLVSLVSSVLPLFWLHQHQPCQRPRAHFLLSKRNKEIITGVIDINVTEAESINNNATQIGETAVEAKMTLVGQSRREPQGR